MTTVTLTINADAHQRQVDIAVVKNSTLINDMLEDIQSNGDSDEITIPLANIDDPQTLEDVISFLETLHQKTKDMTPDELKTYIGYKAMSLYTQNWVVPWRLPGYQGEITPDFMETHGTEGSKVSKVSISEIDYPRLENIIKAADWLNIPCLTHLTCRQIADFIKGKTPEEMRQMFGLEAEAN